MIKAKVKTTRKTHVRKDPREVAKKLDGAYVTVGVHKGAGEYPAPPEGGRTVTVAEVALWNEFGTVNAPERSFLRSAIQEGRPLINQWRKEAIDRIRNDGWSEQKALSMIGFRVAEMVRNKIKSNVPPPNAQRTRDKKDQDGLAQRTLIHTGLLLRSVGYEVVMPSGGGEGVKQEGGEG